MKQLSRLSLKMLVISCLATAAVVSAAHGQTLYFDPSMSGTPSGGSGAFDATTADFDNNGTDQVFTAGALASFSGAAGTVTVGNPAATVGLEINTSSGSTETFNSAGAGSGILVNVPYTVVQIDSTNSSDVVFNTPITEVETSTLTYDTYLKNDSSHNVTFGNITISGQIDTATNFINSSQAGSGVMTFAGAITNTTGNNAQNNQPNPFLRLGANGANSPTATYVFSPTASVADNVGIGVNSGTLLVQTSNIGTAPQTLISMGSNASVLTDAAGVNVGVGTIYTGGNDFIGGRGAFDTTYSGQIANYNGPTTLISDTVGGKVHFTGDLSQSGGFNIAGPGIVSLEHGNDYNGGTSVLSGGTLLLNNPTNSGSGSATGYASNGQSYSAKNFTQVNAGGTLGGTGRTYQSVTALGATSVFSPGDMNVTAGVSGTAVTSTIGTLSLTGGLTASNGATFNFDLNGARTNGFDTIEFGGSTLTLNGPVTINFTNLGGALDSGPYNLLTNFSAAGTGASNLAAAYVLNGPAGYVATLDPSDLLPGATSFAVDFTPAAVPEPSTWALLVGACALLVIVRRRSTLRLS